jgi:hypothetical protein
VRAANNAAASRETGIDVSYLHDFHTLKDSDCLPLSQGDSTILQVDGFASFAGQTKKPAYSGLKKQDLFVLN